MQNFSNNLTTSLASAKQHNNAVEARKIACEILQFQPSHEGANNAIHWADGIIQNVKPVPSLFEGQWITPCESFFRRHLILAILAFIFSFTAGSAFVYHQLYYRLLNSYRQADAPQQISEYSTSEIKPIVPQIINLPINTEQAPIQSDIEDHQNNPVQEKHTSQDNDSMNLFDGKTLNGWHFLHPKSQACWTVENGLLVCHPKTNDLNLVSDQLFDDFELHLEFLMTQGADSGVYLRGRYEIQLIDLPNADHETRKRGAIYEQNAPQKDAYHGTNTWNSLDIKLIGRNITVLMNNELIHDGVKILKPTYGAIDQDETCPGPIMLQCHVGGITKFRNIVLNKIHMDSDPKEELIINESSTPTILCMIDVTPSNAMLTVKDEKNNVIGTVLGSGRQRQMEINAPPQNRIAIIEAICPGYKPKKVPIEIRVGKTYPIFLEKTSNEIIEPSNRPMEHIELFDGKTLNGWHLKNDQGPICWTVENGQLICKAKPHGSDIITDQLFNDFNLHLEFLLRHGADSGIYLRGRYEIQLLDLNQLVGPPHRCGAIYGLIAPKTTAYSGPNKWNSLDVRLVGSTVTVVLNHIKIIDSKTLPHPSSEALDQNENQPGPILLQCHNQSVTQFRNISISTIPRKTPPKPSP